VVYFYENTLNSLFYILRIIPGININCLLYTSWHSIHCALLSYPAWLILTYGRARGTLCYSCHHNKKVKSALEQATKAQGGRRGIATLSLTLALYRGGWLSTHPGRFTHGKKTRYPFYKRLDGSQGLSGPVRKILPPPGFDTRTVQPVASRYTDYAVPQCLEWRN
jgi:hypothetical protein